MSEFKAKITITLTILALLSSFAYSALPRTMNYQGNLSDNTGSPLSGTYNFTFDLFNNGVSTWTEVQNGVSVENGLYSVSLGSVNNELANLLFDTTYTLRISV